MVTERRNGWLEQRQATTRRTRQRTRFIARDVGKVRRGGAAAPNRSHQAGGIKQAGREEKRRGKGERRDGGGGQEESRRRAVPGLPVPVLGTEEAVAWASKIRGMDAHVVMWSNSRPVKVAAVRDYGASVTFCEPVKFAREKTTEAILSRMPNAAFIPSSNDPKVICGQGTLGLEFVEQVKRLCGSSLDAIIVPIGGGGMISGVTTAVKSLCPGIRVIGAEPAEADDAYRSKMSGELCSHKGPDEPQTIADGLKIHLASKAWPVVRDKVDEIVTVSEEEIKRWMKVVYERMKLAIEPSAAVGVAALMSPQVRSLPPSIKKIGVVICGGNVDMASLRDAFA